MSADWVDRDTESASALADWRSGEQAQDVGPLSAHTRGALDLAYRGAVGQRLKRICDFVGAVVMIVLLSPLLAVVALAVKLDSPGPVLFTQQRIGLHGAPFTFYKFRSMEWGCDPAIHRNHVTRLIMGAGDEARSADGTFKMDNDPRVTRVGRFLRRSSIDELPQLFNVLKGEMSLVGPRPAMEYEVALYSPAHRRRLDALPGITGLWQVSGRTRLTFEEGMALDIAYVDSWSLGMDIKILLKTAAAVVGREGAR